jgi:cytoskeletal protein CcmA (bactofilin family)
MPDSPRRRLLDRLSESPTLLAEGAHIVGDLIAPGAVVASGAVTGNGEIGGTLSLGPKARWHGNIRAASAVIAGHVTGDLNIDGKLEIGAGAVIHGGVRAQYVAIAHGAIVDGEISVTGEAPLQTFVEKRAPSL